MSELTRRETAKEEVAPRHVPQLVVPVPIEEVHDFVDDAMHGTSLVDPVVKVLAGWVFFEPHLRFIAVDATHTRIEIDVVGSTRGAEVLLFNQRRAEIDRFFVAIEDELDRRERRRPHPPAVAIDPAERPGAERGGSGGVGEGRGRASR